MSKVSAALKRVAGSGLVEPAVGLLLLVGLIVGAILWSGALAPASASTRHEAAPGVLTISLLVTAGVLVFWRAALRIALFALILLLISAGIFFIHAMLHP
jgi:hypothetical protein